LHYSVLRAKVDRNYALNAARRFLTTLPRDVLQSALFIATLMLAVICPSVRNVEVA